jgi:hypothetical protein
MATGDAKYITEVSLSGSTYWLISAEGGTGWYVPNDALSVSTSFTGTTTNGSAVVTSVSSTDGLYIGQLLSGTGIASGARILTIDSGTQITMTLNATASGSVTITRQHMAKIIDADFPSTATGPFVELDGYVFIGTSTGRIYNSDLNSITAWTSTNWIAVNMEADASIALSKAKNQIVAIGRNHIEFFYNAGNPSGSPLGRTEQAVIPIGSYSTDNIVRFRDKTFFIGQDSGYENAGVWMLSGFEVNRLSTIPLTRMLSQNSATLNADTIVLSAFEHQGKQFVYFGMGDSSNLKADYLYCLESKEWVEAGYPYLMKFSEGLNAIALNSTSGIVYSADPLTPTYRDVGSASYTATIQTSSVDWDTSLRKTDRDIVLVCDQQTSGTATLETNDNDYDSSSWVTRGTFDLTQHRPKIPRGGSYKGRRAYRITHSANTPFRCEALEIEVDVGST